MSPPGPSRGPDFPQFANDLAPDVFQMHSANYRVPEDVPQGTVLVVGGGNTGYQIARELSTTHKVVLAVGGRQTPLPQKLLGRDLFWWLVKTKLLKTTVESRLGKKLSTRDTLIGSSPRALKHEGVEMRPRATGASERTIRFTDGSDLSVDAVIWATGFEFDQSWIELAVKNENGVVQHRRGVTTVEGLYFLGLPWQHTRGSALLGWVKDDAEYIAEQIANVGRQTVNPAPDSIPDAAEAPE